MEEYGRSELRAASPSGTSELKVEPKTRMYYVAKQVEAGSLDEKTLVWVELPEVESTSPQGAMEAAAAREDDAGEFEEGTTYRPFARQDPWTPTKKVERRFL